MKFQNHIAYRFLHDEKFMWEIVELVHPTLFRTNVDQKSEKEISQIAGTYKLINLDGNKNYFITDSVTEQLDLLKVSRQADGRYDYTIFKELPPQKRTFILPDQKLVRMLIPEEDSTTMLFDYIRFVGTKENKYQGNMNNCIFYVNRLTGEQCSHMVHPDVKEIEDYLYKLLCFIYLSETEEVILKPGEKKGTRKQGKVMNDMKFPLVVVTSKWNVTSIRTEGFMVSGHFRLQPYGPDRSLKRVKFIEPFEKHGYIRRAKKELT